MSLPLDTSPITQKIPVKYDFAVKLIFKDFLEKSSSLPLPLFFLITTKQTRKKSNLILGQFEHAERKIMLVYTDNFLSNINNLLCCDSINHMYYINYTF